MATTADILTRFRDASVELSRVQNPAPAALDTLLRARSRALARRHVTACAACGLRDGCTAPVPASWPARGNVGDVAAGWAVVGEAPGPDEDRRGMPFIGKSGQLLRTLMREVGLDDGAASWMNTTSCYPHSGELGAKGDRPRQPSDVERAACRGNLLEQLAASGAEYVLLVGGTAMSAWRGDFKITEARGRVGLWLDRWVVMPVLHPAYLLRNRTAMGLAREDLYRWRLVVGEELEWDAWLGVECVLCGMTMARMDRDGLAWCARCWTRRGRTSWEKEREKWAGRMDRGEQMGI